MRVPLLAPLLIGAMALSGTSWAQANDTNETGEGGADVITLIAAFEDGAYVWVDTDGNVNPTLRVEPRAQRTVHIQQGETAGEVPHQIQIGGGERSAQIVAPGESTSVQFTAPPSGTLQYVCTIHPTTMKGEIVVGGEEESTGGGVPGPGVAALLALLGVAALVARRVR